MPDYLHQDGNHNKLWRYTIDGLSVKIEYGRLGQTLRDQTKTFGSTHERDRFIASKVREKTRKGYALADDKKVEQEQETAQDLGSQYKISKMIFVAQKGQKLVRLAGYDPKKYVYVEILNSWKKTITRLLLNKENSYMISGGVTETGTTITYGTKTLTNSRFIKGVRKVLRRLSEQVVEAIQTVSFAAAGTRKLFDDDSEDAAESPSMKQLLANVDCAGVDTSVVTKFASMGARVLEL